MRRVVERDWKEERERRRRAEERERLAKCREEVRAEGERVERK